MKTCIDTNGWKLAQEKTKEYQANQKAIRVDEYNKNPTKCSFCGIALLYEKRNCKFCNYSCAASFNNKGKNRHINNIKPSNKLTCQCCGIVLTKRTQTKFCSSVCDKLYKKRIESEKIEIYIKNWKAGIIEGGTWLGVSRLVRSYLFDKYDSKCCICGWSEVNKFTGLIPLDVDHIDGNPYNHIESNLRLICKNCHALTETYGGANKGNGRKQRNNINIQFKL